MLAEIVALTLKFGKLLNSQNNVQGFDLKAILDLFQLKSTKDKSKSAYHFLVKQYLKKNSLTWEQLPVELIPETLAQEIRNLVSQQDVLQGLASFEQQKTRYKQIISQMEPESPFVKML